MTVRMVPGQEESGAGCRIVNQHHRSVLVPVHNLDLGRFSMRVWIRVLFIKVTTSEAVRLPKKAGESQKP